MLQVQPVITRRHSRDLHIRLSPHLYERVEQFAGETGLPLNGCVRLLVDRGLSVGASGASELGAAELAEQLRALADSVLAGLIATKQTHLLVADIVPGGRSRVDSHFEAAATAAHKLLLQMEGAVRQEVGY